MTHVCHQRLGDLNYYMNRIHVYEYAHGALLMSNYHGVMPLYYGTNWHQLLTVVGLGLSTKSQTILRIFIYNNITHISYIDVVAGYCLTALLHISVSRMATGLYPNP